MDLIKYDSETGKPLSGSKWDVLEYDTLGQWNDGGSQLGETYLDHPVSEASNIGTNYNWANDNGTQFTRWDDGAEDPCKEDTNVTGEDGYLYDADTLGNITSSKAHGDTYNYTYTKGYCTGHPKPIIEYYEGEGDDVDEKNEELDEIAEEAWQQQVDYCRKLAQEGGFFHTEEAGISDTAKNELQADRDKFFNDYISLTYDYSAKEKTARDGYILHDVHTDDIPVERVVIHSSEYLNLMSGASGNGGGAGGDDEDTYALNAAVKSVSDEEMSSEETESRIEASEKKEEAGRTADSGKQEDAGKQEAADTSVSSGEAAGVGSSVSADSSEFGKEQTVTASGSTTKKEKKKEKDSSEKVSSAELASASNAKRKNVSDENAVVKLVQAETGEAEISTYGEETVSDEKKPVSTTVVEEDSEPATTDTKAEVSDSGRDSGKETGDSGNGTPMDPEAEFWIGGDFDEDLATPSDLEDSNQVTDETQAEKKTLWNLLLEGLQYLKRKFQTFVAGFSSDEDDEVETYAGGAYARNDSAGPTTGGVIYIGNTNFEGSSVTPHAPGEHDIECWTFIAYDHRTEGEIHFNKRDLNLRKAENDTYDAYADENADGTLEGAVYGLFAADDIVHPDSNGTEENDQDTGIVYQKGDLVAVATTDRNGDGSFMAYTEEPGMTYDYTTGKIVKREAGWNGPSNLHDQEDRADAAVEDNEKFYGWNADGSSEVTLTDSEAGDQTFYRKHSSNQGLNCGKGQDDGSTYSVSNNVDNNGNYWIGRPLIVSGSKSAQYYIKELSRSEGYELSVYGSDMVISNRDAFENGGDVAVNGTVSIGKISQQQENAKEDSPSWNDLPVSATDTVDGFDVYLKDVTSGTDNAEFYQMERVPVEKEETYREPVIQNEPVMAIAGQPVLIDGGRVEAKLGDEISLPNGESATVNNVIEDSGKKLFKTKNSVPYTLPDAAAYNSAEGDTFLEKYNNALAAKGFTEPSEHAPWLLVPVGTTIQETYNNMKSALEIYGGFHQIKIVAEDSGNLVVQYDYGGADAIYDIGNQIVWIKKDVTVDGGAGYLYAGYDATTLDHNTSGFMIADQKPDRTEFTKYEDLSGVTFMDPEVKTYWAYASGEQMLNSDGTPSTIETITWKEVTHTVASYEDRETKIADDHASYDTAKNTYTVHFDGPGEYTIRIRYKENRVNGQVSASYATAHLIASYYIAPQLAGTYIKDAKLNYPGQDTVYEADHTDTVPVAVDERPIRQKVKISKDIQTFPQTLKVWYCANCGTEVSDDVDTCGNCGRKRTVEATKSIDFAHDTYAAFFNDDLAQDKQETNWIERVKKWFITITGIQGSEDTSKAVANFRFKAYLKSNLERLYRSEDGTVLWVDRNGNRLIPSYMDTNGDGLYDTYKWQTVYGVDSDFPEKDIVSDDGVLESANVQKIYTEVDHLTTSKTTSARANNVWSSYENPENVATQGIAERNNYFSTNERWTNVTNSDDAVNTNEALYSYVGDNTNVLRTDSINENQNVGYTRLLEMTPKTMEDGAGNTVTVDQYNYEKFFDAIAAANTDKWDDHIATCTFNYNGYDTPVGKISMQAYPGQNWEDTLKAEHQKGDTNTSFDLFRWIHKKIYGSVEDYEKYQGELNGDNTETVTSLSDYARANAEASNAARQFAVKWYLQDEVAKLVKNNGVGNGEDIAKTEADGGAPGITQEGVVPYDDYIHDYALFLALRKAYNYLRPFYENDLDTIYSVEWDSAANGGNDQDVTTLSVDNHEDGGFYNTSAYLPYGTYVIVEQRHHGQL